MRTRLVKGIACILMASAVAHAGPESKACQKDVKFAFEEIGKRCKPLVRSKKLPLPKMKRVALKEARKVTSMQEHYEVLLRIVARMRDGHAYVKTQPGVSVKWPGEDLRAGPGVFFCRIGKDIYVKNAFSDAARAGVKAGDKVLEIDGKDAGTWLQERIASLSRYRSFSTDQQAFYYACHWGLGGAAKSTLTLGLKGKKIKLRRDKITTVPSGPAFLPFRPNRVGRQTFGMIGKWGYLHLRDTPRDLPQQIDKIEKFLGNVPGLILDCRANGGGGTDHDAVFGRFIPKGKKKLSRSGAYALPSTGPNPYGGPIVVIVDAGTRSAGETVSGMFKEDGRAYMIGESATAGMSSSKTMIDLPSGLFSLYVSTHSNKGRFQGGKGIEGLGIQPHEIVEYDPKELAAGKDNLIHRAWQILGKFPANKVPYRPDQFGWKPDPPKIPGSR